MFNYYVSASLLYLFTPVGNMFSLLLLDRFGHKKCMILSNIPSIIGQIILYFAENVEVLYASSILMALTLGFSNAPCLAYAGEVCEPKLRGALTSALNVFYYGGSIILTVVYSITMQWRFTVLLTTAFPILTVAILLTVIGYCAIGIAGRRLDNNNRPPIAMYVFTNTRLADVVVGQGQTFESAPKPQPAEGKSLVRKMRKRISRDGPIQLAGRQRRTE